MASYSHELIIQIYYVKSFVTNFTLNLLLYLMDENTCITNFALKWYFQTSKLEFQSNTEFQQANPNATLSFYSLSLILKGTPSKISGDKKGVLKCCKNSKIDVNLLNKKLVSGKMVIKQGFVIKLTVMKTRSNCTSTV